MSKKEKLLEKFLGDNPEQLSYKDIEKFFKGGGYSIIWGKGSHLKIKYLKNGVSQTVPIHNNDCKNIYKIMLSDFYKLTQGIGKKQ